MPDLEIQEKAKMSGRGGRNIYCDIAPHKLLSAGKYCSDTGSGGDRTLCKDLGQLQH